MKTILLSGALGRRFGEEWNLAVRSPAEAFRAIEANSPGFLSHILESGRQGVGYRVISGTRDLSADELSGPCGRETLHLVPVIQGAGGDNGGVFSIVLGAAIIFFSAGSATPLVAGMAVSVESIGFSIGLGLILQGAAKMLTPTPPAPATPDAPVSLESSYFASPINTVNQGGPVPVGYGEVLVGSQVISAGLTAESTSSVGDSSPDTDVDVGVGAVGEPGEGGNGGGGDGTDGGDEPGDTGGYDGGGGGFEGEV